MRGRAGATLTCAVVVMQHAAAAPWLQPRAKVVAAPPPSSRWHGAAARVKAGLVRNGQLRPCVQRALYLASSLTSVQAVALNAYRPEASARVAAMAAADAASDASVGASGKILGGVVLGAGRRLFSFARLRPRFTYTVGALLRALQLTTPFQKVFNPCVGVGFGCNVLSRFVCCAWVPALILGWASTEHIWRALGARQPSGAAVPISVKVSSGDIAPVPISVRM